MEKRSIYHLVRDSCIHYKDRPFQWIWDETHKSFSGVSYSEWFARLEDLSAFFRSKNVSKGDKIGLFCDNRTEWALCSFSIMSAGAADVPRGCDASEEEIFYILNHTEAKIAFIEKEQVLLKLEKVLDRLGSLETIVLIESEESFPSLAKIRSSRPKHHFIDLETAISEGSNWISKKGKTQLHSIGESLTHDDIATIIYTSGTTGVPKGVVLKHRSFTWTVDQLQQFVPANHSDRIVVFLPPWHIAERILETTLLSMGASSACSNVAQLTRDFEIIKPTVLVSVPRVWEALYRRIWDKAAKTSTLKYTIFSIAVRIAEFYNSLLDTVTGNFSETKEANKEEYLTDKFVAISLLPIFYFLNMIAQKVLGPVRALFGGKLRFAFCGAGAMPPKIQFFFRSMGVPIIETYGMTETTGMGALGDFPIPKTGSIGSVFPGAHIKLVDEKGVVVSKPGVKGIAWHKGPHVTAGYYKNPSLTETNFSDGWFNSGDLFVWTKTGELKFAGRAKDTIVLSSGENVEPEPIEAKILETGWALSTVIVGQDQKFLAALIVPDFNKLKEHFSSQGIQLPSSHSELIKDPKVTRFYKDLIRDAISDKNGFKVFEKVADFRLLDKEFEKGKELTETMKVKRNKVAELYEDLIKTIFA
ncbi:long-chain fatty acid--CoA ligase [Leptospira semungkisensis]|uniref:Long-chain fatty acid--CoA ligase n=1 Tax=Leptospira semungkisensis TaxID=2484985 RepID=A0A4R9FKR2_9LEPT|nr:AMP-binding protein [Leptospira semungkisensis]TGJ99215.1 long-chain fatty acid--CoA ligase [Leptospira semungkisensis]